MDALIHHCLEISSTACPAVIDSKNEKKTLKTLKNPSQPAI
jgi:hypothetical protein